MIEVKFSNAILLMNAVTPLVGMAKEVTINYTLEELSLVASEPFGLVKAALRIKSSDVEFFNCDENSSVCINSRMFHQKLRLATDDDSITITGGDGDMQIGIMFHNSRILEFWYRDIPLTRVNNENMDINEFQNEYEVVVGIPSEEFRRIINHLSDYGAIVLTTITDTQVTFCVEYEELILSKENDECIIGGTAEDDSVNLLFSLYHMESLWNASVLSSSVWIFQSDTSNCLLNCPVAAVGNIMFYFT